MSAQADPNSNGAVARVAYAIGKVIARRVVEGDRKLAGLDGIGKASAIHTLATNMARELHPEAAAAYAESERVLSEYREAAE
jgi:hypothetical protein